MEMHASRSLAASRQQAWEALNDPQTIKACLAGCERFEAAGAGRYSVLMAVMLGPHPVRFEGVVVLGDLAPPEGCTMAFEGQDGVAGFCQGHARLRLSPDEALGEGHCRLEYEVRAQVGGKIAQLGQRLINGAARSMADDFLARLDALMRARGPQPPQELDLSEVHPADDLREPKVDADVQAWEHDATDAAGTPLDAAPAAPALHGGADTRSGIPLWCWALAAVVVIGAVWLLSR